MLLVTCALSLVEVAGQAKDLTLSAIDSRLYTAKDSQYGVIPAKMHTGGGPSHSRTAKPLRKSKPVDDLTCMDASSRAWQMILRLPSMLRELPHDTVPMSHRHTSCAAREQVTIAVTGQG